MLLPRKLIILAIIIHVVTIIACASLQPEKVENVNEQRVEQQQQQADETPVDEKELEQPSVNQ